MSRLIARDRPCLAPGSSDPVPRRMLAAGLGLGLLAAALSLSGCTRVGAGGPRDGKAGASAIAPSLPGTASLVATAAVPDVVPAALAGRTWLVRGPNGRAVAGSLGSGRRLRLPDRERPLAASAGRAASVMSADSGSIVIVRSIDRGRELLRVERPDDVLAAAFSGDAIVLGGHLPAQPGRDPGVVAVSLSDGSVSVLVAPADTSSADGVDLVRTVAVSPSGRTLVSGLCWRDDCALDVIDLSTGVVRRLAEKAGGFPGIVTDDLVIVGSADSDWIAGLDLSTGERRWTRQAAEFQHAYATGDGRIVQALVDRAGVPVFRLEILDPATGTGRAILTRDATDGLALWPEVSDDSTAVVGAGASFADAATARRSIHAAAVDLGTGRLDADALELDLGPDAQ